MECMHLHVSSDVALAVPQVMDLVELQPLTHALVGLPGISGLSVEQRKRLTIAVELVCTVTNPKWCTAHCCPNLMTAKERSRLSSDALPAGRY